MIHRFAARIALANGLLLKPLPVRDPARLVLLEKGSWTNPIWERLRDDYAQLFDGAFAWSNERFDLAPALSVWTSRFVATLLFGLSPRDVQTFGAAVFVLIVTGALAGWLPARRAARADPMHVLRNP